MATSRDINYIGGDNSPLGSSHAQVETFLSAGTIVPGDWVCFDSSETDNVDKLQTVKQVAHGTVADRNLTVGVAIDGTADRDDGRVRVVVGGGPVQAKVAASVAAGAILSPSTAAAGTAVAAVQADTAAFPRITGTTLTAEATGLAWVAVRALF